MRRALQCLALLLPAVAPETLRAAVRVRVELGAPSERSASETSGYLPALGAPPLRFAAATPPPDLSSRPAAAAPPQPALTMTESSVAMANAAAAQSTAVRSANPASPATARGAESDGEPPAETPAAAPAAEKPAPSAILPDEIRPQVRPEDFLPFFQIPGSATQPGDVTLVVPVPHKTAAPTTLPQSSATYTQTPK